MPFDVCRASISFINFWLRLGLVVLLLASGFAAAFDLVMIMTSWQILQQRAGSLVQRAAAASSRETLLEVLSASQDSVQGQAELPRTEGLSLSYRTQDGASRTLWRSGDPGSKVALIDARACAPAGAYLVELQAPLPEWLFAAPVFRALVPDGLQARASACASGD